MVVRRATSRRGVLLIDVIVATVLLGVALTVLIGLTAGASRAQASGERLQIASMLADEQLQLVLARGPDNYAGRFDTEGPCDPPFADYRYELEISGGNSGTPHNVLATILWREGARERSISVETLIAARLGDEPNPERKPKNPVDRYAR